MPLTRGTEEAVARNVNVNVSQCSPVSTQYSAQGSVVPDGPCPLPEMLHVLYSLVPGCVWCSGPGVQRGVSFLYNFMML